MHLPRTLMLFSQRSLRSWLQYSTRASPINVATAATSCMGWRKLSSHGVRRTVNTHCGIRIIRSHFTHHTQTRYVWRRRETNYVVRFMSEQNGQRHSTWKSANRNTAMYAVAIAITVTGLSYAAVPLYRIFCQASGYGGTVVKVDAGEKVEKMEPIRERELTIRYTDSEGGWGYISGFSRVLYSHLVQSCIILVQCEWSPPSSPMSGNLR